MCVKILWKDWISILKSHLQSVMKFWSKENIYQDDNKHHCENIMSVQCFQDCEGAFAFAQMTRAVTAHLGNAADMTVRAAHAYRIR